MPIFYVLNPLIGTVKFTYSFSLGDKKLVIIFYLITKKKTYIYPYYIYFIASKIKEAKVLTMVILNIKNFCKDYTLQVAAL